RRAINCSLPLASAFGGIVRGPIPFPAHSCARSPRMDNKKLDALRRKYSETKGGGEIFDPEFAAVAAQVFTGAERRKWPFADPATFLGLPFRPDALRETGVAL